MSAKNWEPRKNPGGLGTGPEDSGPGSGLESDRESAPEDCSNYPNLIDAACVVLAQGEELLSAISEDNYQRKFELAYDASVGGHYRHCLDHFISFLKSTGASRLDYDDRERDARIENQPRFALELTRRLREQLARLSGETLSRPVTVHCKVSYGGNDSPGYESSLARELVYVVAHAIHHYALISILCGMMDVKLSSNFGIAPSTIAHHSAN